MAEVRLRLFCHKSWATGVLITGGLGIARKDLPRAFREGMPDPTNSLILRLLVFEL